MKYYPYGNCWKSQGNLGTDHLFTGQKLDDTGLYYYGARYYDPTIGRFISPDSIVPNFANPQSLNRYTYALNNPLRYIDPTGHDVDPVEGEDPPLPGQVGGGSDVDGGSRASVKGSDGDGVNTEPELPLTDDDWGVLWEDFPTYSTPNSISGLNAMGQYVGPKKGNEEEDEDEITKEQWISLAASFAGAVASVIPGINVFKAAAATGTRAGLAVAGLHIGWLGDLACIGTSSRDPIAQTLNIASAISAPLVFLGPVGVGITASISAAAFGYTAYSVWRSRQ